MKQTGIVIKINGDKALVKIQRSASCGETCGTCDLCENKEKTQWVLNNVSASEGDRVMMELSGSSFMLMAFTAYIMPLLLAVTVSFFTMKYFEPIAADFIFVGTVAIGIILAVILGKTIFSKNKFQSKITEILDKS